ncbi:MAG: alpha/beta hydrolase [Leptolyngbya sp.]|nr:alpha/beta hydrolase [Leptolyngbya sp.]
MTHPVVTRHHIHVSGQGASPILFAHGFGCDQTLWRWVAPAFTEAYQVITFDHVGSGKSDLTAYQSHRYATLHGYAEDVVAICEALALENLIFVGHSVSGMIGLLASIQAPQYFQRLILVAPSPCYINDGDYAGGFERRDIEQLLDLMERNYLGWASFLAPVAMKNEDNPALSRELEASFCATDPEIALEFARATFYSDHRADLAQAQVPSLILQCAEDSIAPEAVGDYLKAHLPHSTLCLMQATGHCPHMSHPEETIALIKAYLAEA